MKRTNHTGMPRAILYGCTLIGAIGILVVLYAINRPAEPLNTRLARFEAYTKTATLPDTPIYTSSGPLCTKEQSISEPVNEDNCTLSALYIYTPTEDYRIVGKNVLRHLEANDFVFAPDSKYKQRTAELLADQSVAPNLSNHESIIVSLENTDTNSRVMLTMGVKQQLYSYMNDPNVRGIDPNQLVMSLQFYSP